MAEKKYLSLDGLQEYDVLIKAEIDNGDSSTLSSAKSYADQKVLGITSGSTVVAEATHAVSADNATKATQDGNGKVISEQYETKSDATAKLNEAKAHTNTEVAKKANTVHTHAIGDVTNLQSSLDAKVPVTRKINGLALGSDITLDAKNITYTVGSGSPLPVELHYDLSSATNVEEAIFILGNNVTGLDTTLSYHNHDTQYDSRGSASQALADAKSYADSAASTVKNDLLNGAGDAYDTLKELGDLIETNVDAIDALETVASGKADKVHGHAISDITNLQSTLDGKAASSHGTHVSYSTTAPVMDGTASAGTASTVARSDHKHPVDTSRASKSEFDSHNGDTTKHITSTERTNWNAAKTHADSAHAPSNAEKNQNAFSNIVVGSTTIAADTATDSLTLVGSNVTLTPDATNDKVTIGITKANVTAALGYTPQTSGNYASSTHGHNDATTSADGFMTAAMVAKLNGIATGATKVVVDSSLSSSSANPVQNKVVATALNTATSAISANTSSINSHSTAISNLQTAIGEITEITSAEIQALFSA